jgi:hypothetical protein
VLIVGGGPCGLLLANELGRRGVTAVLVDQKPTTAFNPQANATQARTMEHFRRLGFAHEIRSLGLPPDFPTDIAYFTRYAHHELARFKLPSASEATERIKHLSYQARGAPLNFRIVSRKNSWSRCSGVMQKPSRASRLIMAGVWSAFRRTNSA